MIKFLTAAGIIETSSVAARCWTIATLKVLGSLFPNLNRLRLKWGIYAAPKAKLRRGPMRLPDGNVIEDFGISNVSAVWPTKLTLGPLVVNDIVERVIKNIGMPSSEKFQAQSEWPYGSLKVLPEKWRSISLSGYEEFKESLGLVE